MNRFSMILKSILLLFIVALLSCGKATLDTSSDEKKSASLQLMMSEIKDDTEKAHLHAAINALYVPSIIADILSHKNADKMKQQIDQLIHGKTADEIFDIAEELKQQARRQANE